MTKTLNFNKICRLCLDDDESDNYTGVFEPALFQTNRSITSIIVFRVIEEFTTVKITPFDGFPQQICDKCFNALSFMYEFRETSLNSDLFFKKHEIKYISPFGNVVVNPNMNVNKETTKPVKTYTRKSKPPSPIVLDHNVQPIEVVDTVIVPKREKTKVKVSPKISKYQLYKRSMMPCDICGKLYENGKLKYHMNVHAGLRPYMCVVEDCTKTFTSPFQLRGHHKICHTNNFPYKCEICGKQFKVNTTYKIHKSYHGDPQIPCEVCGKLLRNYRTVKKHMMSHTGERPYPCDQCSKSFQNRYNLKVHKRVHTKEKPFVCYKCGESFGYNCLLKAHMEKQHGNDDLEVHRVERLL